MSLGASGAKRNQVLTSTSRQSKKSKWVLHNSKTVVLFAWLIFKFDTLPPKKPKIGLFKILHPQFLKEMCKLVVCDLAVVHI